MKHKIMTVGMLLAALVLVVVGVVSQKPQTVGASGQTITPFVRFGFATSTLIGAASQLVDATNTARVYLRLSNLSGVTIYCSDRASAAPYTGMAVFASSTLSVVTDENPYTGPLYCVSPSGAASTTLIEK